MRPRVYIASKLKHAPVWKEFRNTYKLEIDFTSRWFDIENTADQKATVDRDHYREVWDIDYRDVRTADFCILYADQGEHLRGALVEAGMMLASGGKVIVIGEHEDYGTWQSHRGVYHEPCVNTALDNIAAGYYGPNR